MAMRAYLSSIAARALQRPVRFVDRDKGGYWCWDQDDYFLGHICVESTRRTRPGSQATGPI